MAHTARQAGAGSCYLGGCSRAREEASWGQSCSRTSSQPSAAEQAARQSEGRTTMGSTGCLALQQRSAAPNVASLCHCSLVSAAMVLSPSDTGLQALACLHTCLEAGPQIRVTPVIPQVAHEHVRKGCGPSRYCLQHQAITRSGVRERLQLTRPLPTCSWLQCRQRAAGHTYHQAACSAAMQERRCACHGRPGARFTRRKTAAQTLSRCVR